MRTAILGVGRMGRRHIQVVRELGYELVGVYDISETSLDLARAEHALADHQLFTELDRLYAVAKPQLVIVATTADFHCELTCMAAERGARYVLVEKPMAVSLEQCDRMIEACRQSGAKLSVNHQMRFMAQYTEPKRLFGTDAYGDFSSMTVVAGNIGFSMNGSHYFEAFRFLAGEPVVEIAAWFSPELIPNPRGARFQDRAGSLRAVTANGKRLYMEIGADQGHGMQAIYACRRGMVIVDEVTRELYTTERLPENRELPTTRAGSPGVNNRRTIPFCGVIETTADVIRAMVSGDNDVTGEHGRSAVEVLVAAYHAAETGRSVKLGAILNRSTLFPWA